MNSGVSGGAHLIYSLGRIHMIINVKVRTNQPSFSVHKISENDWVVSVKSLPEANKANMEILKELGRSFGVVKIISGAKSSRKKFLLE